MICTVGKNWERDGADWKHVTGDLLYFVNKCAEAIFVIANTHGEPEPSIALTLELPLTHYRYASELRCEPSEFSALDFMRRVSPYIKEIVPL